MWYLRQDIHIQEQFTGTAYDIYWIKPYKCDTCKKAFTGSKSLQRPVKIHTGECNTCNKFKCDLYMWYLQQAFTCSKSFVVYSTRRFVLCLALCYFVLLLFSPFSIVITSPGEERANLSSFHTFFRFALVWVCLFPFPLVFWEELRFVIVVVPGLFSYLFLQTCKDTYWRKDL